MASKEAPRVFNPSKKHHQKRKKRYFIAIVLVFLFLATSGLLLARFQKISFVDPFKFFVEKLTLKEKPDEKQSEGFEQKAWDKIDKKILTIASVSKGEDSLHLKTKEGTEIFLSSQKDLDDQVRTLQTLLSKAKIDMREILVVDFRFEKLAVQYK